MIIIPLLVLCVSLKNNEVYQSFTVWSRNGSDKVSINNISNIFTFKHTGVDDYSITPINGKVSVEPGEYYKITAEMKIKSPGTNGVALCCVTYDNSSNVISWAHGSKSAVDSTEDFVLFSSNEFLIPFGVKSIVPRIIGLGVTEFNFRDLTLMKTKTIDYDVDKRNYTLSNDVLEFVFDSMILNFSVLDKRNGRIWNTYSKGSSSDVVLIKANTNDKKSQLNYSFVYKSKETCNASYSISSISGDEIEFAVACPKTMDLVNFLYPFQIVPEKSDRYILPINEGFTFRADDFTHGITGTHMYGGHGLCMAFVGMFDDSGFDNSDISKKKSGLLIIAKTPNDLNIWIQKINDLQHIQFVWNSEVQKFGYERSLRYVFFKEANHVEMCKRYRKYSKEETGLLVTFEEKKKRFPLVEFDKLIGAANIWHFSSNKAKMYETLQKELGIDRILSSNGGSPEIIDLFNENNSTSILTSIYDIYQDVLNPDLYNWTTTSTEGPSEFSKEAWPNDIIWKDAVGNFAYGWSVKNISNSSQMIDLGVLCDKAAEQYALKKISKDLTTNHYKCRFIDTTTASSWRECYNPNHLMTRTESREYRVKLLALLHEKYNLVCGSETGHEAAVPYCDYFEGMMSLGNYRVPDSGRKIEEIWENEAEIPSYLIKFQMGHDYRLPLFELVYHDCLVSYWYWGDNSNKIPSLWRKRDLFNMLYGVPPMYIINDEIFKKYKNQFGESYKVAAPIARETGYSEMTDFLILTADRSVQRSVFANGIEVTTNFGSKNYVLEDGSILKGMNAVKGKFDSKKKSKVGLIVGVTIAVVVIVVAVTVGVWFYFKKKKVNSGNQLDV